VADNAYDEGLNLTPPGAGFELWRHRNSGRLGTEGWSGLYWARRVESGGYEIRSVLREGEAYSHPGGVFPAATFKRFYERVDPGSLEPEV
jgi:hypothetical protein